MIKIIFNLEIFTKSVNISVPWNITDAYMCTFFPKEVSESSQPGRESQRRVILSNSSSVMGNKGQQMTARMDEIDVQNYLELHHHHYPLTQFFIDTCLSLYQKGI